MVVAKTWCVSAAVPIFLFEIFYLTTPHWAPSRWEWSTSFVAFFKCIFHFSQRRKWRSMSSMLIHRKRHSKANWYIKDYNVCHLCWNLLKLLVVLLSLFHRFVVFIQVTLGVIEENPSTVAGVTNILRRLHKYVPEFDGDQHIIPCHGDGLSVERMRDSQRHNAGADTPAGRLEGVVPVPQEFHKRMLLLEVMLTILKWIWCPGCIWFCLWFGISFALHRCYVAAYCLKTGHYESFFRHEELPVSWYPFTAQGGV